MSDKTKRKIKECNEILLGHETRVNAAGIHTLSAEQCELMIKDIEPLLAIVRTKTNLIRISTANAEVKTEWNEKRTEFEDNYLGLLASLKAQHKKTATPKPGEFDMDALTKILTSNQESLKCPKVDVPVFDGNFQNWSNFRDLFETFVNSKTSLTNTEKMHYLAQSMKLPPNQNVLSSFTLTGDHYDAAWAAVQERFNNKRKLLQCHLMPMFGSSKMSNGSAEELQKLIDVFATNLSALEQHQFPLASTNGIGNLLIVSMVMQRLDEEVLREFRREHDDDTVTWDELKTFLKKYMRSIEDIQMKPKPKTVEPKPPKPAKGLAATESSMKVNEFICFRCKGSHALWDCSEFLSCSVSERRQFVKNNSLCFNCFGRHQVNVCRSKRKCKCGKKHHVLLHLEDENSTRQSRQAPPNYSPQPTEYKPLPMLKGQNNIANIDLDSGSCALVNTHQCLLSTVLVKVRGADGQYHLCRAMMDSGSTVSFITSSCAKRLGLELRNASMMVTGINGKATHLKHHVQATLESRLCEYMNHLVLYVMDNITDRLPNHSISLKSLDIPSEYHLADPNFWQSGEIDMLLDNNVYLESVIDGRVKTQLGIQLRRSVFGWMVGGCVPMESPSPTLLSAFAHCAMVVPEKNQLDSKLDKFFDVENCEFPEARLSHEEQYCEDLFASTTTRDVDGRFVVRMPMKENYTQLGRNHSNALRCLHAQESRRKRDSVYDQLYVKYMDEFLAAGHMSEVQHEDDSFCHFLPHHGVVKMSSTTTKLRPVCNASSRSETGLSLNDVMCVGPTVQPESFDILLRFREKAFVMMADITKMYLQIWIHPSQRDFLRLFWRSDMSDSIREYRLNCVCFGTAAAPWLATRAIMQLAEENRLEYPEAAAAIEDSTYVDDVLVTVDSIEEGIKLRDDLRSIFASAGMTLCKWGSNHAELLNGLPDNLLDTAKADDSNVTKALGVGFHPDEDNFFYSIKPSKVGRSTKTSVLSELASIYDPNGWVGPVVLQAKLLMKELWMMQLDWKDKVPMDFQEIWDKFRFDLVALNSIRISRHCYIPNHVWIELHGFADASIKAYGTGIYVLSYDEVGNIQVSLITAKSRVAPKNQKTLARLELCASVLLAKLIDRTLKILKAKFEAVTCWSDSTIVLHWITMTPSKLSTFVGNRVAVVQELTHRFTWKHIRGEENPADVISRGLDPKEILINDLWWNGPTFFRLPQSDWPTPIMTLSDDDPEVVEEVKKCHVVLKPTHLFDVIENRFSDFNRIMMMFTRVNRAIAKMKDGRREHNGFYTVDDHVNALHTVVRIIQAACFSTVIEALQMTDELIRAKEVKSSKFDVLSRILRKSPVHQLSPFLDSQGILRVGGRTSASTSLSFEQKHQILLPSCNFTSIFLRHLHEKHLHAGQLTMMSIVKDRFWIVRAKSEIRKVVHGCVTCFRAKPTSVQQFMGSLPEARVSVAPPFASVAVDYAGFYMVKSGFTRNAPGIKAYVAVFKCMRTGAIHLELVSDLTSKAFIAALERFVSRRGCCAEIFSDNGTCFVGADNELKQIVLESQQGAHEWSVEHGIIWKFTTPVAPHAGGIYESGVKSMKHHLKRVLGQTLLTFERFVTVLCKIEAILNSRPLTPLGDDPNDFRFLTPGHFLIGRPLVSIPQKDFSTTPTNRLDHWEGLQKIHQQFWNRWRTDYLHQLQPRPKNRREVHEFRIGDIVLLKDNNLPPMRWSMGRIEKLYPNRKDKVVRNVSVRTQQGLKDRHVEYLCLFPFNRESDAGERVARATVAPQ